MIDFNNHFDIEIMKTKSKKIAESTNHSHPYYELLYIRSGSFNYFIENKLIPVKSKNVILINKNTLHKAIMTDDVTNSYFIIKFRDNFLDSFFSDKCKKLFETKQIVIDENNYLLIDMLFSKMYREYESKLPESKALVKYQLSELMTLLSRITPQDKEQSQSVSPSVIEQAIEYINQNAINSNGYELNLEEIAHKFSMSSTYFSRVFKKTVGMGFKEYIISSKILYAKKLIQTTDLSITEIAFKCGFSDSNYFSTVFKKSEAISPSKYRHQINKLVHKS